MAVSPGGVVGSTQHSTIVDSAHVLARPGPRRRAIEASTQAGGRPDLVIFDCDGVLVDTERVAAELMREALSALGVTLGFDEAVARFKGRSGKDCLAIMERDLGVQMSGATYERCRRGIIERFEADPQPIAGIHEALATIASPVCVASSGEHDKMRRTLGATGLLARFEGSIFSATEVERGKPAPDLFLHAAARLGAAPAGCVVVEDSIPGVEAGVAAGMTVLGYVDLTAERELRAAGAICFDDMRALPELLAAG